jgi:hypothetical protein
MNLSKIDLVAANMRNAIFDASSFNIFEADDRQYEQFDAQILETCYQKTDAMSADDINLYAECISMGFNLTFDRDTEAFSIEA